MATWGMMSDLQNKNCNDTLECERLHAPDGMNRQDELVCAESSYQTSCSQGQDQDDFLEDFSLFSVPELLTGFEEEEMNDKNNQTTVYTEFMYTGDVYTGDTFFLYEEEARKSRKRKHSELCCMDVQDMEEPCDKVHIIDGLNIC